jgi:peptidoglycan/xylan/chitin deacetylase (PgdA/CDA1 family)
MKYKIFLSFPIFFMMFYFYISYLKSEIKSHQNFSANNPYYLVPVILFHDIDGKGPYSVTREEFRNYLNIIKEEKIQIVSLKTLYQHAIKNQFFDKPTMVITIDDDYVNIVRVLAPILREYHYPATFFFYVKDIQSHPTKGTSWEDLKRLLKEDFDIQNHSFSHTVFHKKKDGEPDEIFYQRLYQEIVLSKKILESNLNHTIWAFAYPMGYYTEETHQYIFKNDYKIVLTTDAKPLDLSKPFDGIVHRYTIQKEYVKDPVKMFYLQISYAKRTYQTNKNISSR